MERMLTGKHEELPTKHRQRAEPALLPRFDNGIPRIQTRDLRPDLPRRVGRVIHLLAEGVNVARVLLERGADFVLEVVDDYEVREEGDEVFDAEEFAAAEKFDGIFDPGSWLADLFLRNEEPQSFAEFGVSFWSVGH